MKMTAVAITRDGIAAEPQTIIFPIFKEIGAGRSQMVGTGFFITKIGHFVTAKHVIEDIYNFQTKTQLNAIHAVHFVKGFEVLVRHITAISFHNTSDIAVGKMDYHVINSSGKPLFNKVPTFSTNPPPLGSSVVTFAYPGTDKVFSKGESGIFRAGYYHGEVLGHSENKRDSVMVTWPHYITSIDVKGGASGGPVFDYRGRVIAVNCVSGIGGLSYMARVSELLDLTVPEFPMEGGRLEWPSVQELIRIRAISFDN